MKGFVLTTSRMNYVRQAVDEETILKARDSLLAYIPQSQFTGNTFLDVGCGSGIFSLAAARLNCRRVVSFDMDPLSVEATKTVQERLGGPVAGNTEWEIFVGDILSESLVSRYKDRGDIVYSWGVLHHTGRMWDAIKNEGRGPCFLKCCAHTLTSQPTAATMNSCFRNRARLKPPDPALEIKPCAC